MEGSTRQGPLTIRSLVSIDGLFREVLSSSSSADALTVLLRRGVLEVSSGRDMLPSIGDGALEFSEKPLSGSSEVDGANWRADSCWRDRESVRDTEGRGDGKPCSPILIGWSSPSGELVGP